MEHKILLHSNNGTVSFSEDTVTLVAKEACSDTRFSLSANFPEWEKDAYVFLPACAYNGNKMKRRKAQCSADPLHLCRQPEIWQHCVERRYSFHL